jgi:hypothetical protein
VKNLRTVALFLERPDQSFQLALDPLGAENQILFFFDDVAHR